jgi:nucleoid DNA-binding protein
MEEHQTYVKKDVIRYISERLSIHREDVCLVIDKFLEFLEKIAEGKHKFYIMNYFSVDFKYKQAHTINWSLNGKKDKIHVPERYQLIMKPGSTLRRLADPEFFNRSNFEYDLEEDKDPGEKE